MAIAIPRDPQPLEGATDAEKQDSTDARKDRKLDAVVKVFQDEAESNRTTRRNYAYVLLGGLFLQAIAINVAFFQIGYGRIEADEWTARIFIVGAFTEIAVLVRFIVKYLFTQSDKEVLALIEKLE